ncbi:MAG TPA: sigma-70 family RNA polymerase sigma factor [Planctomycetota bacterium]|nr:sigma-70 family RNA polymerase sigma factor [Planctomycetota bacterium]
MEHPTVDAEFVLAHQDYVKRLARGLVFDEAGADDLAQQVWLAALQHPPANASGLRGWLATIARNLASLSRRGAARRSRHEQESARPESVAAADELLVHEATRTKLVQAVLALDEPFRETVILRYFDELSPRAIATKQGVPVATVKSRLKRGLASLRARLDREGGGRAAWSLALVNGLHLGPGAAKLATIGAQSLVTGVALMTATKKIVIAAVIVVACFLAWRVTRPPVTREGVAAARPLDPASLEIADAVEEPALEATLPANTRRPVPPPFSRPKPAAKTGPGDLEVSVVTMPGLVPLADVAVMVRAMDEGEKSLHTTTARTDFRGVAQFRELPPGDYELDCDRGSAGGDASDDDGDSFALVVSGELRKAEIRIENPCTITGRVVDEAGKPVQDAEIWLAPRSDELDQSKLTSSDAGGRFEIKGVKARSVSVFAKKRGHAPSKRKFNFTNEGATFEVELALRGPAGSLDGFVRDSFGAPVPGALVLAGPNGRTSLVHPFAGTLQLSIEGSVARTDKLGHYEFDGILAGPAEIRVRALESVDAAETLEILSGAVTHHDVLLSRGAVLSGKVINSYGKPAIGGSVEVRALTSGIVKRAIVDETGSYHITGIASGAVRVTATDNQRVESLQEELTLSISEEKTWNAMLSSGLELVVRVLDENEELAKDVRVEVFCSVAGKEPFHCGSQRGKDGLYHAKGCPSAPCVVKVFSDKLAHPIAEHRDASPGGAPVVVRLDPVKLPSVFMVGRVVGPDGQPIANCDLCTMNSPLDWAVHFLADEQGKFKLGPYPPGPWSMKAKDPRFVPFLSPERELVRGETWDLGTITLGAGELLAIRLIYPDEPQHTPPAIRAYGLDSGQEEWCPVEGDRARPPPLAPGRYELRVAGAYAASRQVVEVIAGTKNEATVALQPGVAFTICLKHLEATAKMHVRVLDAQGTPLVEVGPYFPLKEVLTFPACLAPGHYRIEASVSDGRKANRELDVDAALTGNTIELALE